MNTQKAAAKRLEQLERYGMSLFDMPKEAFIGQGRVILAAFSKKIGLIGLFPLFSRGWFC